jgi:hypothetical protein
VQLTVEGSAGTVDLYTSYLIFHINPAKKDSGEWDYKARVITFASNAMCAKLLLCASVTLHNELRSYFDFGAATAVTELGAIMAGQGFEALLRGPFTLAGKFICATNLSGVQPVPTVFPAVEQVLQRGFYNQQLLAPVIYYWPEEGNFCGIDSFVVVRKVERRYDLVVVQITISGFHRINLKWLQRVWQALTDEVSAAVDRIIVLVCTSMSPTIREPQKLTDRESVQSPAPNHLLDTSVIQCVWQPKKFERL